MSLHPRTTLADCGRGVAMRSSGMDWTYQEAPTLDEFEEMARAAFALLPAEFRALVGDIAFVVQDFPDDDTIRDMELESEFEILGLFHGSDLAARVNNQGVAAPTMIF